jgi:hypothetical protein
MFFLLPSLVAKTLLQYAQALTILLTGFLKIKIQLFQLLLAGLHAQR